MTIDRRTVVLGVAAVVAVAAAVSVTAVNHRSQASPERRAVTAYIHDVNGVQNQMHTPLTRVLFAFRDFTAKRGPKKTSATELHSAARTLDRLNRRLVALPAPPEAAKLRRLILHLVQEQTAITHEVEQMAVFSPKFAVLLTRARAANTALGRALGAVQTPKAHKLRGTRKQVLAAQRAYQADAATAAGEQADAVDAYDREIAGILERLHALRPPHVFAAGYRAQVTSLTDVVAAGGRLADGLRSGNRSQVPALGRRFTLASREAQSLAAQQAQIAAIRAYNARAKDVSRSAGRVQTELLRLQKALP